MAVVANSPFKMSSDEMWEIKRVMEKRVKKRFSDGLSPEGQLAMKMAREDSKQNSKADNLALTSISEVPNPKSDPDKSPAEVEDKPPSREISFAKKFDESSSQRLEGDITDDSSSAPSRQKREALDGSKLEGATETIEYVNADEKAPNPEEEESAIEETAKINSVEKCMVWMEVNDEISAKEDMNES